MPLTTLAFMPGIHSDLTDYSAEGTWVDGSLIRWRDGLPESMRPWEKFNATQLSGVPRAIHTWAEIDGTKVIAVGTSKRLYLFRGGGFYNITPIESSGALGTDPFTTSSGSSTVTVTHAAHERNVGDTEIFAGATTVNGLDMNGEWVVATVPGSGSYTFEHTGTASGSGSGGGGSVTYQYELGIGKDSAIFGRGWGTGPYGAGTWGTPRDSSALKLNLRTWFIGNWGEDLLAMPSDGGSLYHWDATNGPQTRAQLVANAPTDNTSMVVSPEDRHVIVFGADGDPLAIQSCDQEDFTEWTIDATTDAILRRLLHGSSIIAGYRTKGEIVIWTDGNAVYQLQYVGGDFTFNLRRLSEQASLIGKKAMIEFNGIVVWMGRGAFYRYDGMVRQIPCPVLRTVFDDIDRVQADKITAGVDEQWSEVTFFYPTASGGGENDRYVRINMMTGDWAMGASGDLPRTAWIDRGIFRSPLATSPDGYVYEHDMGAVDQSVTLTVKTRKYPGSNQVVKGPWAVTPSTTHLSRRARGRTAALRIEGTFTADGVSKTWFVESGDADIGDGEELMLVKKIVPDFKWGSAVRLGRIRVDAQPDGGQ